MSKVFGNICFKKNDLYIENINELNSNDFNVEIYKNGKLLNVGNYYNDFNNNKNIKVRESFINNDNIEQIDPVDFFSKSLSGFLSKL